MELFRDSTGRHGPATWQGGTYPQGQEDSPVRGVSWHEAAAYAVFAGKQLPTMAHWVAVAGSGFLTDTLQTANFGGAGPLPGERGGALHRFGTMNLAGNVKEWVANSAGGDLRYTLGGAWDEPAYMGIEPDARSALERASNFGFRCARFDAGDKSPERLAGSDRTALAGLRDRDSRGRQGFRGLSPVLHVRAGPRKGRGHRKGRRARVADQRA